MRDNGLDAATYAAIGDLDQRITDAVLALLRDAAVAAYVEPGPIDDAPTSGERDRLFVDANEVDRALEVLQRDVPALQAELPPEPDMTIDRAEVPDDVVEIEEKPESGRSNVPMVDEAAWADIVASYNRDLGDAPVGRWPAQEDVEPEGTGATADSSVASDTADGSGDADDPYEVGNADRADHPDDADDEPGSVATRREGPEVGDAPGSTAGTGNTGNTAGAARAASAEDHFIPPVPPPLPDVDKVTKAAWIGLIGGPLLLLLIVLADLSVPSWLRVLAVAACGGGFLTLVLRSRDGGGGGDDGAVV